MNQSEVCAHTAVYVNTLDVLLPFRQKSAASPSDIHTFFSPFFLSLYLFLFVCFSWFFFGTFYLWNFSLCFHLATMYNMHIRNDLFFFFSFIPKQFYCAQIMVIVRSNIIWFVKCFCLIILGKVSKGENFHWIPRPFAPMKKSLQYHGKQQLNSNVDDHCPFKTYVWDGISESNEHRWYRHYGIIQYRFSVSMVLHWTPITKSTHNNYIK